MGRTFSGGVTTDNLASAASLTPGTLFSLSIWFNTTTVDAVSRRLFEWGTTVSTNFDVCSQTGIIRFRAVNWTAAGTWSVPVPSTGANHHLLIVYDAGATGNNPVIYIDKVSQTVTTVGAPTGTWAPVSGQLWIGNTATIDRAYVGNLSACGLWNSLLVAGDATDLGNGAIGTVVKPSTLLRWFSINGASPEKDFSANNDTATVTGTSIVASPTILLPRVIPGMLQFPSAMGAM